MRMTEQEQKIIKICGDLSSSAFLLDAMHGRELDDINFHLRAIQNIIYARQTMQIESR